MPRPTLYKYLIDGIHLQNKFIVDSEFPDLALRVTPTGKVWMLREKEKTAKGRPIWTRIPGDLGIAGKGETSLEDARKVAAQLLALGGAREAKKAAKREAEAAANKLVTFGEIALMWFRDWQTIEVRRPDSVDNNRSYMTTLEWKSTEKLEKSALWNKPIREVSIDDITLWQNTILRTPDQANNALWVLKKVFEFARLHKYVDSDIAAGHNE